MPWDEFGLIAACFRPLSVAEPGAFALTDDAAVLAPASGTEFVVTADALVAGVHFFPDDPPGAIAKKAMRVNLSDLAAMGAKPRCVFLTCAFPADLDKHWLNAFADGLGEDLQEFGVALAGGDVVATPGPLTLSVTAIGEVPSGAALRRSGVRDGDVIAVTGSIGDAALGLDMQRDAAPEALDGADRAFLLDRYRHPTPRIAAGAALLGRAHAAMDVSDGLLGDLRHLAEASRVDILIDSRRVPLSEAASRWIALLPAARERALTGGDDYELAFACAVDDFAAIARSLAAVGVSATAIGRAETGEGRVYRYETGRRQLVAAPGGHRHGGEANGRPAS